MDSSSSSESEICVGVLALQGAFHEHVTLLNRLPGVRAIEVRTPDELALVKALVIPGGESTTIGWLAERSGMLEPLRKLVSEGVTPVWGTCAGMILLARDAVQAKKGGQVLLGGMDILVDRNHFGTQLQSFETQLSAPFLDSPFRAVFIRAPAVLQAGPGVEVLARLAKTKAPPTPDYAYNSQNRHASGTVDEGKTPEVWDTNRGAGTGAGAGAGAGGDDAIVAVKQGRLLATAFHPELTGDTRWHEFFVRMVRGEV